MSTSTLSLDRCHHEPRLVRIDIPAPPEPVVQKETTLFLHCILAVAWKAVLVSEAGLDDRSPQQVAADFARLIVAAAAGMTPVEPTPTPVLLLAHQPEHVTEVLS